VSVRITAVGLDAIGIGPQPGDQFAIAKRRKSEARVTCRRLLACPAAHRRFRMVLRPQPSIRACRMLRLLTIRARFVEIGAAAEPEELC
jgi:hypothetical protein